MVLLAAIATTPAVATRHSATVSPSAARMAGRTPHHVGGLPPHQGRRLLAGARLPHPRSAAVRA
eukprot:3400235-Heterocapsa_arctica.AAC.1